MAGLSHVTRRTRHAGGEHSNWSTGHRTQSSSGRGWGWGGRRTYVRIRNYILYIST